ncbi:MAG: hypothetical protein AB7F67_09720 [Rhodospirillaceae bacterium]
MHDMAINTKRAGQAGAYETVLATGQRVNWQIEDIIGGDKQLDFARPFMPEALARTAGLDFLSPAERTVLNQIRGHEYLNLFGLVEEFILPFVLDHARPQLRSDDYKVRALLQFAAEEAKHIHLFKRFRDEFTADFGTDCAVIGPPDAIARAVLAHHPLAVALVVLHIEWMTQRHYLESVRDDGGLDAQFCSLLRHHWMEEAQHTKLDTLMVEALAEMCTPAEIERAIEEYFEIGGLLDAGLAEQVAFNFDALEQAIGRSLDHAERRAYAAAQTQALRWTYLGSGMSHPKFLDTVGALGPAGRARIEAAVPTFS